MPQETKLNRKEDFRVFNYYIYERPYLHDFFNEIKNDFHLAVWSSASDDYVEKIVNHIFPTDINLHFVWARSRCKPKRLIELDSFGNYNDRYRDHYNYIKPLKKVKKLGYKARKNDNC